LINQSKPLQSPILSIGLSLIINKSPLLELPYGGVRRGLNIIRYRGQIVEKVARDNELVEGFKVVRGGVSNNF